VLHVCTKTTIHFLSKNRYALDAVIVLVFGNNDHNFIALNGMMRQGLLMKLSIFTNLTATNVHRLQSFSSVRSTATTGLENI